MYDMCTVDLCTDQEQISACVDVVTLVTRQVWPKPVRTISHYPRCRDDDGKLRSSRYRIVRANDDDCDQAGFNETPMLSHFVALVRRGWALIFPAFESRFGLLNGASDAELNRLWASLLEQGAAPLDRKAARP